MSVGLHQQPTVHNRFNKLANENTPVVKLAFMSIHYSGIGHRFPYAAKTAKEAKPYFVVGKELKRHSHRT